MNDPVAPMLALGEAGPWQRALRAQEAGDYAAAAALYSRCEPADPAHGAEVAYRLGCCLEQLHEPQRAAAQYERSVALTADSPLAVEVFFRLAWLEIEGGAFDRARPVLARVLALAETLGVVNPTVEHAGFWFAVCLENDGELIEAGRRFRAIAAAGNADLWHEAAYRRLLCLAQIGDLDAAVEAAADLTDTAAPVRDARRLRHLQDLARDEREQIERARAAAEPARSA